MEAHHAQPTATRRSGDLGISAVSETRKLAAILVSDIVGYSRLAGADEDRILARLRTLRSDLIDPTIAVHHGRIVKRTGDGAIIEFRSVVDAVRCAIEVQKRRPRGCKPGRSQWTRQRGRWAEQFSQLRVCGSWRIPKA
jgi:class 3 adenylate cyclase